MKKSAVAVLSLLELVSANCPPAGLTSVSNFDVNEYARATWYVQEQQVNAYQSEEDLYCVTATYDLGGSVPFFGGTVVSVYNQADSGGVNAGDQQESSTVLCGRVPDNNNPSKLLVAPCFLPNFAAGPYWVVAIGRDGDHYNWAVVSGGEPTEEMDDGCTTRETGINGSGLWIFSREQILSPEKLAEARDAAVALGYSLSRMNAVPQEGCLYENRFIKANNDNPDPVQQDDTEDYGSDDGSGGNGSGDDSDENRGSIGTGNDAERNPDDERGAAEETPESKGSDSIDTGILAGLIAAGLTLAVGATVFVAGVIQYRRSKSPEAGPCGVTIDGGGSVHGTRVNL